MGANTPTTEVPTTKSLNAAWLTPLAIALLVLARPHWAWAGLLRLDVPSGALAVAGNSPVPGHKGEIALLSLSYALSMADRVRRLHDGDVEPANTLRVPGPE